jgi:hypothetical protein
LRKLLLILGNGFSIDFINKIEKSEEIDVSNLFRLGHTVKFPYTKTPGFLSHRHSPALWLLGARPYNNSRECMAIIEEIITCSNMLFDYLELAGTDKNRLKLIEYDNQSTYIRAYSELIAYLKYLFIDYNNKVSATDLDRFVSTTSWGWVKFLKDTLADDKYEKVNIITYNYDVWLERLLDSLGISYTICGCDAKENKVNIIKPHGSISFTHASGKNTMYDITYKIDSSGTDIDQIKLKYNDLDQYDKSYLIPPAGDSSRRQSDTWAAKLRECAISAVKDSDDNDDVYICGMSYWHVDRKELDELLINLNQNVNITLVNPNPPKELNAVLVSLFKNYTVFTSSDILKEAIK